jgi:hypothetical protein
VIQKTVGWIDVVAAGDHEALWIKLRKLISRHSSVRTFLLNSGGSADGLKELFDDLTQELYLRLHEKGRLREYLDSGYTDEQVEQELYRIEVPNLISRHQRQRQPESYRIARRISELIQKLPDFRLFERRSCESGGLAIPAPVVNKMALKMYGLRGWPAEKIAETSCTLTDLIKDVPVRLRNNKRIGRGEGAQLIISSHDLKRLICDIFSAIDTPVSIKTMRSLVISKLSVQDCKLVPIDATSNASQAGRIPLRSDPSDPRPTPLETLLAKEAVDQIQCLGDVLLGNLSEAVRNKPSRFRKLVEVAWHCYFDPSSPSQTSAAEKMGISTSLVSHYRRIFDEAIRTLNLSLEELTMLDVELRRRLSELVSFYKATSPKRIGEKGKKRDEASAPLPGFFSGHAPARQGASSRG